MFNKLKFIPLILISFVAFSFAEIFPTASYDYRLRITDAGDMWLYYGTYMNAISKHCRLKQIEKPTTVVPYFDKTSFKINSFYSDVAPQTISPGSSYLHDPYILYKYLGYDDSPCPGEPSKTCTWFKYDSYQLAQIPNGVSFDCVSCNAVKDEYFDSTTGLCVNKCEDITNQNDRLDCMCKRAGKIGYSGDFTTMRIFPDGPHDDHFLCNYGCETTKDDPEARPNGDYTKYSVSYDVKDTDSNANGVCFADDTYAPNATPGPNPKPDDPGNNNGTKPGGDIPKPNKPDKPSNFDDNKTKPNKPDHGGGGHSGGVGGGSNPDKPGDDDKDKDKNGTHPGGGGGGKPGDKDDDQSKFDFSKLNELNETVEGGTNKFMKIFEDAKDQIVGAYNRLKKGQLSDFKVHGSVNSCPYTRDFFIKEGLTKKITVDICAVVKDTRPVLYFIFYALFLFLFSLFTYKAVARLL